MELSANDKINNKISVLLVIPRNNRLYDYYIDGHSDRRTMLQKDILKFSIDLCPDHAEKIRKSIVELTSFILFITNNEFKELKENAPPKLNKKEILFPINKLVKNDRINLEKNNKNSIDGLARNFSIWEQYNIYLNLKKNEKKSAFKDLFS